ncbi:Atxe2 family lasso peptide isopeptidase [Allosphingosinicella indica]|uniref:Dipeptidyl aminopeptidase/acylaminoacyl peptidase n=1 Tax=Allosphingosinicella indica TaxID=941907 RepID=A0A1X7FY96_9SPHN|nr:Atxe2 family lasso peptide isopeptidase [Allosphingosinicella indica]SMF60986.1 Dipeptidyl aminopeptidase/acylaminoacyl peptidase [Allosphingosinicella indica]
MVTRHRLLALAFAAAASAAPAAAPTIAEIVEVADITGLAVSPDGLRVAYRVHRADLARNDYALEWRVAEVDGGADRRVGGGGAPVYVDPGAIDAAAPVWSADGSALFHRVLADGAIGLWRTAADGSASAPVAVHDGNIRAVVAESGGRTLRYATGASRAAVQRAERAEYDSGIRIDPSVDLMQALTGGGMIDGRKATQRLTGVWFARKGLLADTPLTWRSLNLQTLADASSEAPPLPPVVSPIQFTPPPLETRSTTGNFARAIWDDGRMRLEVETVAGVRHECPQTLCAAGRFSWMAWQPGRDVLLVAMRDGFRDQTLFRWSVADGDVRRLAGGDGLLAGDRDGQTPCAAAPSALICVASSPIAPPRIVAIDIATGSTRLLHDPNAALRARDLPQVERLAWASAGGTAYGLMLTPRGPPVPRPLFISYYRCQGYLRGGEGDEWPFAALIDAGFAVVCINAVDRPGNSDGVTSYRDALDAIEKLVVRESKAGRVDRDRVGMGGFSFGSEVTMWVARNSSLLKALSLASTQPEPHYYWANAMRGRMHPGVLRDYWGLGAPEATPEHWRLLSPALDAARIRAPLLLQLPEHELRGATELHARLSNLPTPVEMYGFPDEAHYKLQPRHKAAAYARNLDWFRFWLQGVRDPDPLKAEQFARWEALASRWRGERGEP